jgi:erythritol transport system ATP-binding protein
MAPPDRTPPALEARGVTRIYPGTIALDGVDVAVHAGQVHALIGENGAGKSTLVKILAGVEQPTDGRLILAGKDVRFASARDAAARGVGIVHQELQLFPDLSVAENLFVGRERTSTWGMTVDRAGEEAAARSALARLKQDIPPRTRLGALPLGQQQIVEIARALVHDTRILMMDEPTSALSRSEIPVLFQVIRDLTAHGVGIVYISHRLDELLEIADRVTVLRDGRVVGAEPAKAVDVSWIVERMTGRPSTTSARTSSRAAGEVRLSVAGLSLPAAPGRARLADVTFDARAGEIVGLYGLMGAGRTELLESLMGVHPEAAGTIRVDGRLIGALDVTDRMAAGLAMVPEDRQAAGLVNTMSVRDNMTLSSLDVLSRWGYLAAAAETRAAERLRTDLRIKTPALTAPVTALSGGNQQKVVIARGLMRRPGVLLLDDPTRGVDVAAKTEILDAMRRLAAEGLAVVFASSDLGEILSAATRILVMARGRITAAYAAADATDDRLVSAASPGPSGVVDVHP